MPEFRRYLDWVSPMYLKEPIWLRRDGVWEVVADFLKGEVPSKYGFRRSQVQMLLQSILFSMVWMFAIVLAASVVRYTFNGRQGFEFLVDLSKIDLSWVGGFLLAASAVYWNFSKRYGEQWTYCAGVFNKIFYDKFPTQDPTEHLFRKATFAIDLLDCNLWHHKSFCMDFNYILECAVLDDDARDVGAYDEIKNFQSGEMSLSDARKKIAKFQNKLELFLQTRAPLDAASSSPPSSQPSPSSKYDDVVESVGG